MPFIIFEMGINREVIAGVRVIFFLCNITLGINFSLLIIAPPFGSDFNLCMLQCNGNCSGSVRSSSSFLGISPPLDTLSITPPCTHVLPSSSSWKKRCVNQKGTPEAHRSRQLISTPHCLDGLSFYVGVDCECALDKDQAKWLKV